MLTTMNTMMFMWTPELYIARQRRALAWKVVAIIGLLPLLALAIWLLLLVTEHYFSYLHNTSMGGFYRNYAFFIGWMEPLLAAVFLVAVLIGIVAVICFATGNYKKMRLDGEALYFEIYKLNARIDSRIKSLRSSSLVLGILSLALLPLLITWPACAVLGIVGIAHAQELYVMTRTYTAGLVTSIIGVVVSVFLILMLIASLFLTV